MTGEELRTKLYQRRDVIEARADAVIRAEKEKGQREGR